MTQTWSPHAMGERAEAVARAAVRRPRRGVLLGPGRLALAPAGLMVARRRAMRVFLLETTMPPFDLDVRDCPKRRVVDYLAALATDPTTPPWSARVYVAAAVLLESERGRETGDDDRTSLTIAAERVRALALKPMSVSFRSFLRAWLPADDAEQAEPGTWGSAPWGELEWSEPAEPTPTDSVP